MDQEMYFMLYTLEFMYVIRLTKNYVQNKYLKENQKLRIPRTQNVEKTKIQKYCMLVFTFPVLSFPFPSPLRNHSPKESPGKKPEPYHPRGTMLRFRDSRVCITWSLLGAAGELRKLQGENV